MNAIHVTFALTLFMLMSCKSNSACNEKLRYLSNEQYYCLLEAHNNFQKDISTLLNCSEQRAWQVLLDSLASNSFSTTIFSEGINRRITLEQCKKSSLFNDLWLTVHDTTEGLDEYHYIYNLDTVSTIITGNSSHEAKQYIPSKFAFNHVGNYAKSITSSAENDPVLQKYWESIINEEALSKEYIADLFSQREIDCLTKSILTTRIYLAPN